MGQPFVIRVNVPGFGPWGAVVVPRGGDPAKDAVTGISGVSATDRPTIKLSTLGLSPGAFDAVMLDGEGVRSGARSSPSPRPARSRRSPWASRR